TPDQRMPATDEMFTMAPRSPAALGGCATITGSTYLQVRNMLLMLTAETRSHSASERSTGPPVTAMPTLLWRMSMRPPPRAPNAAWQCAAIAATWSDLETSHAKTSAAPPSFVMMAAVSRAAASLMSLQSTLAPSRANSTAAALPLPQPGPDEP